MIEGMTGPTYHFPVVFEKEPGGYGVHVVGLEGGIFSVAETLELARTHAVEAIRLHLSTLSPEQLAELEPYTKPPEDVQVEVVMVPPLPPTPTPPPPNE